MSSPSNNFKSNANPEETLDAELYGFDDGYLDGLNNIRKQFNLVPINLDALKEDIVCPCPTATTVSTTKELFKFNDDHLEELNLPSVGSSCADTTIEAQDMSEDIVTHHESSSAMEHNDFDNKDATAEFPKKKSACCCSTCLLKNKEKKDLIVKRDRQRSITDCVTEYTSCTNENSDTVDQKANVAETDPAESTYSCSEVHPMQEVNISKETSGNSSTEDQEEKPLVCRKSRKKRRTSCPTIMEPIMETSGSETFSSMSIDSDIDEPTHPLQQIKDIQAVNLIETIIEKESPKEQVSKKRRSSVTFEDDNIAAMKALNVKSNEEKSKSVSKCARSCSPSSAKGQTVPQGNNPKNIEENLRHSGNVEEELAPVVIPIVIRGVQVIDIISGEQNAATKKSGEKFVSEIAERKKDESTVSGDSSDQKKSLKNVVESMFCSMKPNLILPKIQDMTNLQTIQPKNEKKRSRSGEADVKSEPEESAQAKPITQEGTSVSSSPSGTSSHRKLYEFDENYLDDLNKIRKQFRLKEIPKGVKTDSSTSSDEDVIEHKRKKKRRRSFSKTSKFVYNQLHIHQETQVDFEPTTKDKKDCEPISKESDVDQKQVLNPKIKCSLKTCYKNTESSQSEPIAETSQKETIQNKRMVKSADDKESSQPEAIVEDSQKETKQNKRMVNSADEKESSQSEPSQKETEQNKEMVKSADEKESSQAEPIAENSQKETEQNKRMFKSADEKESSQSEPIAESSQKETKRNKRMVKSADDKEEVLSPSPSVTSSVRQLYEFNESYLDDLNIIRKQFRLKEIDKDDTESKAPPLPESIKEKQQLDSATDDSVQSSVKICQSQKNVYTVAVILTEYNIKDPIIGGREIIPAVTTTKVDGYAENTAKKSELRDRDIGITSPRKGLVHEGVIETFESSEKIRKKKQSVHQRTCNMSKSPVETTKAQPKKKKEEQLDSISKEDDNTDSKSETEDTNSVASKPKGKRSPGNKTHKPPEKQNLQSIKKKRLLSGSSRSCSSANSTKAQMKPKRAKKNNQDASLCKGKTIGTHCGLKECPAAVAETSGEFSTMEESQDSANDNTPVKKKKTCGSKAKKTKSPEKLDTPQVKKKKEKKPKEDKSKVQKTKIEPKETHSDNESSFPESDLSEKSSDKNTPKQKKQASSPKRGTSSDTSSTSQPKKQKEKKKKGKTEATTSRPHCGKQECPVPVPETSELNLEESQEVVIQITPMQQKQTCKRATSPENTSQLKMNQDTKQNLDIGKDETEVTAVRPHCEESTSPVNLPGPEDVIDSTPMQNIQTNEDETIPETSYVRLQCINKECPVLVPIPESSGSALLEDTEEDPTEKTDGSEFVSLYLNTSVVPQLEYAIRDNILHTIPEEDNTEDSTANGISDMMDKLSVDIEQFLSVLDGNDPLNINSTLSAKPSNTITSQKLSEFDEKYMEDLNFVPEKRTCLGKAPLEISENNTICTKSQIESLGDQRSDLTDEVQRLCVTTCQWFLEASENMSQGSIKKMKDDNYIYYKSEMEFDESNKETIFNENQFADPTVLEEKEPLCVDSCQWPCAEISDEDDEKHQADSSQSKETISSSSSEACFAQQAKENFDANSTRNRDGFEDGSMNDYYSVEGPHLKGVLKDTESTTDEINLRAFLEEQLKISRHSSGCTTQYCVEQKCSIKWDPFESNDDDYASIPSTSGVDTHCLHRNQSNNNLNIPSHFMQRSKESMMYMMPHITTIAAPTAKAGKSVKSNQVAPLREKPTSSLVQIGKETTSSCELSPSFAELAQMVQDLSKKYDLAKICSNSAEMFQPCPCDYEGVAPRYASFPVLGNELMSASHAKELLVKPLHLFSRSSTYDCREKQSIDMLFYEVDSSVEDIKSELDRSQEEPKRCCGWLTNCFSRRH